MKLNFDIKENMSLFAYFHAKIKNLNSLSKLNDIVIVRGLLSNWYDAIFLD